MIHAALAGLRALNDAWDLDDARDSVGLLTNILQLTHHFVMATLGAGVVDLQKQYSKYVVGPSTKEDDDSTTAIDDDYKKRTMVDFSLHLGRVVLGCRRWYPLFPQEHWDYEWYYGDSHWDASGKAKKRKPSPSGGHSTKRRKTSHGKGAGGGKGKGGKGKGKGGKGKGGKGKGYKSQQLQRYAQGGRW
jgi:hypothetical protein